MSEACTIKRFKSDIKGHKLAKRNLHLQNLNTHMIAGNIIMKNIASVLYGAAVRSCTLLTCTIKLPRKVLARKLDNIALNAFIRDISRVKRANRRKESHPYPVIYNDMTICSHCGQHWDTNDPDPPECE